MPRHIRSDRDQAVYRTYDDRIVTRQAIESALRDLELRERRRELWQQVRTWLLLGLLVVVLLAASVALIWWRLTTPL